MVVSTWSQTNLFESNGLLILTSLVFFFRLLILEPSIVHELTDRWISIRRYLNKVKIPLTGYLKCAWGGHYSDHVAVLIDHANFTCSNTLVHSRFTRAVVSPKIPINRLNLLFGKQY